MRQYLRLGIWILYFAWMIIGCVRPEVYKVGGVEELSLWSTTLDKDVVIGLANSFVSKRKEKVLCDVEDRAGDMGVWKTWSKSDDVWVLSVKGESVVSGTLGVLWGGRVCMRTHEESVLVWEWGRYNCMDEKEQMLYEINMLRNKIF